MNPGPFSRGMDQPIVTLLTDFGVGDPFVGIMKGVILGIAPDARIVDLAHEVPGYDILGAAFLLHSAWRYFPPGSVHVVVVDPGVGSPRRGLAVEAGGHLFVAPDNGVLTYVLSGTPTARAVELTAQEYFLRPVSASFHGRDVFAPVAAHLARGVPLARLGRAVKDPVRLELPGAEERAGALHGEVIRVDRFGNLITSIDAVTLAAFAPGGAAGVRVHVGGRPAGAVCGFFAQAGPGGSGALVGSAGHLEVFVNQGSAAERFGAGRGTPVVVTRGGGRSLDPGSQA